MKEYTPEMVGSGQRKAEGVRTEWLYGQRLNIRTSDAVGTGTELRSPYQVAAPHNGVSGEEDRETQDGGGVVIDHCSRCVNCVVTKHDSLKLK